MCIRDRLKTILGWSEEPFDEAYYKDHEFVAGDIAELSKHGVHAEYLQTLKDLKAEIQAYLDWAEPKVAEGAGFVSASGRWELRIDEGSREPLMTLSLAGADSSQLRLSFDVPLANVPRGDLKRFFQLANHIACHLGGVWVDGAGNRIEAAGGLILQDEIEHQDAQMAASGVRPGSERARLLFSRSA